MDLVAIQQLLTEKAVPSFSDDEGPFLRREPEQQERAIGESNEDSLENSSFNDRLLAMRDTISLLASKNSNSTLHKAIPMLKVCSMFI